MFQIKQQALLNFFPLAVCWCFYTIFVSYWKYLRQLGPHSFIQRSRRGLLSGSLMTFRQIINLTITL